MRGAKNDVLGGTIQRMLPDENPKNFLSNTAFNPKVGQNMGINHKANLASQRNVNIAVIPKENTIQTSVKPGHKSTTPTTGAKIDKSSGIWSKLTGGD